jgi:predicted permease
MWQRLRRICRSFFRIKRMEREMDEELRFHVEMQTRENLRRGLSQEEARRAALLSFGGVERFKEECRDVKRLRLIEALWQDVRYGARILLRSPGFTLVAVITLALGIGANTAIFSVIYGVLLRPLPFQSGDQLVVLRQQSPRAGLDNLGFSVKEIADYRAQNQTLDELVEHHSMAFILYGGAEPQRVQTGVVSANFFDVMGVRPLLGRAFLPADEAHGADAVLILSYDYWQRSHGGDPNIVGKVFQMNDRPHTVVGVLPPIPQHPNENDVYMPVSACPTRSSEQFVADRTARMMSVFGRLKSGAPVEQAQTDAAAIAGRLQQAYPEAYPASRGYQAQVTMLREELTRQAQPTLILLLGTAGLVLLIACANVANFTLARAMRRERELAVRAAMGASRARLIRQLLTESSMLALIGGLIGVLIAAWGLDLLVDFAARMTPRAAEIKLDGAVMLFTLLVSTLTGLASGLMPALSIKNDLVAPLKDASAQTTAGAARLRVRSLLLIAQVAVSFMLLVCAGLMLRSLFRLQQVNPGFNPERVLVMRISPNWSKYDTGEQYRDLSLRLLDKLKDMPGATSAAIASTFPLNPLGIANGPRSRNFQIEGRPQAENEPVPQCDLRVASAGYFQTIGLPLIKGRLFADSDNDRAPAVAIINQAMARHRWGGEDPVGRRISFDRGRTWATIIGVVGDVKQYGLNREPVDEIYRPVAQAGGAGNLLVRTAVDPLSIAQQVRRNVHEIDPETAVDEVQTLEQARDNSLASSRLIAVLLSLFAALALLITATGIAGVMALSVTQRTHEIGVRIALGATQTSVLYLVIRQGLGPVTLGLALGSLGALAITQLMSSLLFATAPSDPVTFLAVSLALFATAAIACYIPARRVTMIDPLIALRNE